MLFRRGVGQFVPTMRYDSGSVRSHHREAKPKERRTHSSLARMAACLALILENAGRTSSDTFTRDSSFVEPALTLSRPSQRPKVSLRFRSVYSAEANE